MALSALDLVDRHNKELQRLMVEEVTAEINTSDDAFRPVTWDGYIGQGPLKQEVGVAVRSAKAQDRACRPILLVSPPGMGKTTLAAIVANELEVPLRTVMCPFEPMQVARLIRGPAVLFFDEIHRVRKPDQEVLLTLVEDGEMAFGRRKFKAGKTTIIAATTEPQKLLQTLVDRFEGSGMRPAFDPYSDDEMGRIVDGMFTKTPLDYSQAECIRFGVAANGTPRIARGFVVTAVDMAQDSGERPAVENVLALRRVRPDGLSIEHCRYLWLLAGQEGRASLALMSTALGMPPTAIEQTERLLTHKHLLLITPRGRQLSEDGWMWVDENPDPDQPHEKA